MPADLETFLALDLEIADLWPAFAQAHPGVELPSPLTRGAFLQQVPTLGPWLVALGVPLEFAQLSLESMWCVLAGLHGAMAAYQCQARYTILLTACPRVAVPFDQAVGFASILFDYPAILGALQPGGEQPDILADTEAVREAMARVQPWDLTRADGTHHVGVSLADVVDYLSPFATLPDCVQYWDWIRDAWAPAIARHGYYDPATGHEAPVGQEWEAIARYVNARVILNALLPGLGDDTLAAGEASKDDGEGGQVE